MPAWRRNHFAHVLSQTTAGPEVVLFAATFNTYFHPKTLRAAVKVLQAGGYTVVSPMPAGSSRPLCCGRTFLNVGLVEEAKAEARRTLEALAPYVDRGIPIVGLEPSCLLTLRDEFLAMYPGEAANKLAERAMLFEEVLVAEHRRGKLALPLGPLPASTIAVHTHCHQKAFGLGSTVEDVLRWIPAVEVELMDSGCCGMAGAFGYEAEHYEVSMKIGELDLLPKVRSLHMDTLIVADGFSCRHQIRDGAARSASHVASVLERALV
jgi:Fe-S oxidoreductase